MGYFLAIEIKVGYKKIKGHNPVKGWLTMYIHFFICLGIQQLKKP